MDEEKLKGQIEILRKADFIIQEENDNQIFYKIKDKRIIKILELLYSYCSQLDKEKLKNIEDLDVIDTLL
ncbi:MAG: hypothetical protein GF317_08220 [Candidatus Lokiarchaeota archaeon]|nr:hypothetical protein [Candidatus Lokiarchaeota archaeon]MBD3199696.1 hypothetical protein [Candidatus Lokiarchaeota archaeon]